MASTPPFWKQLFDEVDRRLAPSVNEAAQSDDMATAAALAVRGRREVEHRVEQMSRRMLHALNLPAGSDVNRLLGHIAQLEREVRDLREQLADRENVEFLAELQARHDEQQAGRSAAAKPSKRSSAKRSPAKRSSAKRSSAKRKAS